MKIKPQNPYENDLEKTLVSQNRSGSGAETGGGIAPDVVDGGGGNEDPNGPPKAGASVCVD